MFCLPTIIPIVVRENTRTHTQMSARAHGFSFAMAVAVAAANVMSVLRTVLSNSFSLSSFINFSLVCVCARKATNNLTFYILYGMAWHGTLKKKTGSFQHFQLEQSLPSCALHQSDVFISEQPELVRRIFFHSSFG